MNKQAPAFKDELKKKKKDVAQKMNTEDDFTKGDRKKVRTLEKSENGKMPKNNWVT